MKNPFHHRPHGQERTADDPQRHKESKPEQLTEAEQKELVQLVRKYKQSWFLRRRMIVKRVLKAYEFFKGNHFISFDPESFQWFDAVEATFGGDNAEDEAQNLYQFATNFYQMLGFAFVAALSTQMPKTRFLPENAEREEDIATARAASRIQEIIERQNKIKSLQKQGLLFLWMSGCYFRHTRYVVDGDRAGTHKEPVVQVQSVTLMPARYACSNCAHVVPAQESTSEALRHGENPVGESEEFRSATVPAKSILNVQEKPSALHKNMLESNIRCPRCGTSLSDHDFYPAETAEIPVAAQSADVPNGMVAMTLYSPLMVDSAPYAKNLRETPILNVDEEVDLSSLRASYPEQWESLKGALGPMLSEAQNERMARQMIYSEEGSQSSFMQDMMPTLSRTWIQPWAFNAVEDKNTAIKLKQIFPRGCLLVNVGDLFLEAREARLTDEWTWAGTVQETFGLYPPAVGDAAIPVQERINDASNITHEYMNRIAAGIVLYNSNLIDGEAFHGKSMAPGMLNGVKMKQTASAMGNRLEDAIVQIKAEIDANIYSYQQQLVFTAQLISGTPPQVFGGAGDPHIETKGGQEQQLSTAMGKLSLFWDNIREEHAQAAEAAVECAQANMTDDLISVIADQTGEYRNQYVRLDELQGSVHALPETDQGFPMSAAEMRDFWMNMIQQAERNPFAQAVMEDPGNQEQAAQTIGVPGLVVPGRDMRNKVLRILDMLMEQKPVAAGPLHPQTGKSMIELPSIQPDKTLDDMDVIVKTVRHWAQKNFDKQHESPDGFRNVVLYYKLAVQYGFEQAQKQQPPSSQPNPAPPPKSRMELRGSAGKKS
jgi:hypothetical protein